MAVLVDIQVQITRKNDQITTTEERITFLTIKEGYGSITPEEQIELDDLRDNVLPEFQNQLAGLQSIETKMLEPYDSYLGLVHEVIDTPKNYSSKYMKEYNSFAVNDCINSSTVNDLNDAIDSLTSMVNETIDDIFGDSLTSIQTYLSNIDLFTLNMSLIDDAIDSFKIKLVDFGLAVKGASDWAKDPCTKVLSDKLISYQSSDVQSLYSDINNATEQSDKANVIKNYLEGIKI